MSFILDFKDIRSDQIDIVGGKGLSLGRLSQASLPVPPGFVITTGLFRNFKVEKILSDQVQKEINDAFDDIGTTRVAVRSSAISEDSEEASWAGQFESYMNVTKDELIKRVLDCWDSVKGAGEYAQTQGLKEAELILAVVVQKMVDSDVSGVAFSVNPLNHNSDEIMIEATWGLGELLVQGMVTPDNYVLSKSVKSVLSSNISTKDKKLAYQDGDTKEILVDADMQDQPCLTTEQLVELTELICHIEDYYHSPQDIEWALQDNKFFILQSRPITTI